MATADPVTVFENQRRRLFGIAYRLLGSATEAEDVVQEAYLRWHGVDPAAVAAPPAWLAKVVTNLCLNRLTSARAQREVYPGPWLPEPVLTGGDDALGPLEAVEQRDSVSFALLTSMERLTPAERAVFVLREAFAYSFREIGDVIGHTESGCRQLHRRAKQHLSTARPRHEVSREHGRQVVARFLAAARGGELERLEHLLAADVISWSDGGGKVSAGRRPVVGAERVARFAWAPFQRRIVDNLVVERFGGEPTLRVVEVNGEPALVAWAGEQLIAVAVFELAPEGIAGLRVVMNPDKLVFIGRQLSRIEAVTGSSP
ncbi:RNA polymerase sigma-70 factor [Pseudonocardia sichuanensis]